VVTGFQPLLQFLQEFIDGFWDGLLSALNRFTTDAQASLAKFARDFSRSPLLLFAHLVVLIYELTDAVLTLLLEIRNALNAGLVNAAAYVLSLSIGKPYSGRVIRFDKALKLILTSVGNAGSALAANPLGPWKTLLFFRGLGSFGRKIKKILDLAFRALFIGKVIELVIIVLGTLVATTYTLCTLAMLAWLAFDMESNPNIWMKACLPQTAPRKKWYAHRGLEEAAANKRHRIIRRRDPGGVPP
jgi:hypothetical protein